MSGSELRDERLVDVKAGMRMICWGARSAAVRKDLLQVDYAAVIGLN